MDVHVYGPNLVTVRGPTTEKGKDKEGKQFTRSYVGWIPGWSAMANGSASPEGSSETEAGSKEQGAKSSEHGAEDRSQRTENKSQSEGGSRKSNLI